MFNLMALGSKINEISAFLKSDSFKEASNVLASLLDAVGFTAEAELLRIEASDASNTEKLHAALGILTDIFERIFGKPPMVMLGNSKDALCCKLDYFSAACMVTSAEPVPAGMSPALLEALITIGIQAFIQFLKNRHK